MRASATPSTPESDHAQRLESFLARIYVDDVARQRFIEDPQAAAVEAGLSEADTEALQKIDLAGLELAAESFRRKRERTNRP